jgi:hypothetical protein
LEFDWHSLSKTISLEFVIITFWGHLKTKVGCDIFQESHGERLINTQKKLIRINFMDSLDRTKVCSFYLVVYLFIYLIIVVFNCLMDSPKINEIDVLSQDL